MLPLRIVRSDGVVRHVRMRVLPGAARPDEPPVFVGAVEDVTDEVGALHVATDASVDDPFRTLVVSSPLGVCHSDVVGRVNYVNQRWLDICGIRAEDILGTDDLRVAHPEDRVAIFESMSAASLAGEEWFGEMRVLRPDGEIRFTRTSLAAIRDPNGAVTGYVGTLEDVTDEAHDRREAERALEARAAAEALVAETSRMLVTASVQDVDERVDLGARAAGPVRRRRLRGARRPGQRPARRRGPARLVRPGARGAGPGYRRRLADRHRGVDRLRHARMAPGGARRLTRGAEPLAVVGDALDLDARPGAGRARRCGPARSGSARWPSTPPTTCSSTASSATSGT